MPGVYGGLIVIIMYAGGALEDETYLITQSDLDILTQDSRRILVQPQ